MNANTRAEISEKKWGFPIVTADNIFDVLAYLGIKPWPETKPPMSLAAYTASELSETERADLRFAPQPEVVFLRQPDNKPFTGFRSVAKDWACVFALLPGDLVPVVGEFKHGIMGIVLATPSGVPGKADAGITNPMGKMLACAEREFTEETGIPLASLELLCSETGLGISTRKTTEKVFPCLGSVEESFTLGPSKLDNSEFLKMVLVPLNEWLKLIAGGYVEAGVVATTFLALQRLGRLQVN